MTDKLVFDPGGSACHSSAVGDEMQEPGGCAIKLGPRFQGRPKENHERKRRFRKLIKMAHLILRPSLMRATGSAASMRSSYQESFLLTSTPFTVTCTTFIVTRKCNRNATNASTNLNPNTPIMLKRTFQHPVSPIPCQILDLQSNPMFEANDLSRRLKPQLRNLPSSLPYKDSSCSKRPRQRMLRHPQLDGA